MQTNVVVAGWGQITQPKETSRSPQNPMGLMAQAAQAAAKTLANPDLFSKIEGVLTVKSLSAYYDAPALELSERLNLSPEFTFESRIGGNSPQTLINRAAGMIARNELNMVLVAGAEAYVPRTSGEARPENALLKGIPEDYSGSDASGVTSLETRYGIKHPMHGFPLFETALWAESKMGIHPYLEKLAGFWSEFSQRAAAHPFSWTQNPRTATEIFTPSPQNRPIAFPYTKYMNSFVTVDQGAAIILMSQEYALTHGGGKGKTVYFLGGGYAEDAQPYMIQKSDFTSSPPLKSAVDKALDRAAMTMEEIDCFDLYSCFPCAVSMARKMLDISDQDSRPITLTGGLGFFGGPGNNYNLHAVATLCEMIAGEETRTGLVTALGWMMQKHAAGIYSALPPKRALDNDHLEDQKDFLAGPAPVDIDETPKGRGIIETYTIVYKRDGQPDYGVIYGRTDKGLRFIAQTPKENKVFNLLATHSMVGKPVTLTPHPETGLTIARFA